MDITPGSEVKIEITANPRREAARKTLTRICSKDPEIVKKHRYRKNHRPSWQDWIRGGKFWHHQMKSFSYAAIEPGRTYNVKATVDVIRDLGSVSDLVKVTAR